jgi:4-carboxymuconolactone decarboxylase
MPRLSPRRPADLDGPERALYDAVTGGPRAQGPQLFPLVDADGGLRGPFEAMLRSPAVGGPLQALGVALRYGSSLAPRVREMAVLAVAAAWDSTFEREAHEAVGRHVGLTEDELAALRDGAVPALADPVERAALDLTRALLAGGRLADADYEALAGVLGERQVFELSTLVGYYATLALQMRLFATC